MKNINREINKKILEIMITIIIVNVSLIMQSHLSINKSAAFINKYNLESNNITYYIDKYQNLNNIIPIRETDVNKNNYTNLVVLNNTKKEKDYKLLIAVPKNIDFDLSYINININDNISKLTDLYYSENEYINYYLINGGKIDKQNQIDNQIILWLDEEAGNEFQNKNFTFEYNLI